MKTATLFILSSLLLLCGSAYAQLSVNSCQADIQQYCAKVQPGGGAITACLKKHETSLSSSCNDYRQLIKERLVAFINACTSDSKTYCANVQPGQGRIYACLKKNEAKLTATCKNQIRPSTK